ncbi:hypothetical protein AKJ16_DCAP07903 [Drosera capensis]
MTQLAIPEKHVWMKLGFWSGVTFYLESSKLLLLLATDLGCTKRTITSEDMNCTEYCDHCTDLRIETRPCCTSTRMGYHCCSVCLRCTSPPAANRKD